MVAVSNLRGRLERLEQAGGCPECGPAREALLAMLAFGGNDTPTRCPKCNSDVRPTVFDLDRIREQFAEGEG